ncbi:MAG: hypothetical protein DRP06_00610 [Candidatus Aenigmatarchaeota archaeon]|nr:MAG: hypothetical protein DRP06_00610 [Candidatus Aenigmarchaeota archaeon]
MIFIDDGFLSKLTKYLGEGKYLKYDVLEFSKSITKNRIYFVNLFFSIPHHLFKQHPQRTIKNKGKKSMINLNQNFQNIENLFLEETFKIIKK